MNKLILVSMFVIACGMSYADIGTLEEASTDAVAKVIVPLTTEAGVIDFGIVGAGDTVVIDVDNTAGSASMYVRGDWSDEFHSYTPTEAEFNAGSPNTFDPSASRVTMEYPSTTTIDNGSETLDVSLSSWCGNGWAYTADTENYLRGDVQTGADEYVCSYIGGEITTTADSNGSYTGEFVVDYHVEDGSWIN